MFRKLLIAAAPIVAIALLTAGKLSDNGKAGNTGSPGELTCTDCHNTFAINTGIGSVSLSGVSGGQYTPGQLYSMKVTVRYSGRALFGVGLEALNAAGADGGRLIITDPARTQIKTATVSGNVRRNLVHQLNGGAHADSMEFNFAWRAPYKGTGTVTFYFCGVAANADGSENNDYVYQGTNLVLTEGACASTAPAIPGTITPSANPFCSGMTVSYSVAAVSGATSYEWYFPNNWSTSDSITTLPSVSVTTNTNTGSVSVMAISGGCAASPLSTLTVTAQNITTTTTGTNPTCGGSNGSVSVTASNGVIPYTYVWRNGTTVVGTTASVAGLSAGSYTVTVTDSRGCTKTATRTLTASGTAVVPTASGTNITCTSGSTGAVNVTVTGGTAPYTYAWRNGTTVVGTTQSVSGLAAGTYTVTVTDATGCTGSSTATITSASSVTASATSTNANCSNSSNGSVSVTAGGGTTPFTYSWRNAANTVVGTTSSVSNLPPGTYTVTVTDASGCTATSAATVAAPPALTSTTTGTNPVCFGTASGSVAATAGGGTAPYTYTWRNGTTIVGTTSSVSGLAAGSYTVSVTDAAGCTTTGAVTLSSPTAVVATANSVNPLCSTGATGTASATATGGTGPYTYNWRNGTTVVGATASVSGLSAGTYTITVTDSRGCTGTSSVTLTAPAAVTVATSSTNPACNNSNTGSVSATAGGGTAPYTYTWRNGTTVAGTSATVSNLAAGTYVVTITDSRSCTATASVTLTAPSAVTAVASVGLAPTCYGASDGSVSVTSGGGTAPYTYAWSNGSTSATATNLQAGSYTVTVTDARGCTKTASVTLTQPAAISLTVSHLDATCGQANGSASVAASGTASYTYLWSTGASTPSLTNLVAGTYSVTVTDGSGCTATGIATVSDIGGPAVTLSATQQVTCYGGADGAVTAAVNGTSPFLYVWSTGDSTPTVTGLSAGTYQLNVTDSLGCLTSGSITVTQPTQVSVSAATLQPVCEGDAVTFSGAATGGTGAFTYVWSNTAGVLGNDSVVTTSATVSGSCTLTATDANGCSSTATVLLTVQPGPVAPSITNSYDTLFVSPAGNYQWFLDGNPVSGVPGSNYLVPVANGNYTVVATDQTTGCTSTSAPFSYLSTGTSIVSSSGEWSIFPNPACSRVLIHAGSACRSCALRIVSVDGRIVFEAEASQQAVEVAVSDWAPGVYSVLLTDNGFIQSGRLVIQR